VQTTIPITMLVVGMSMLSIAFLRLVGCHTVTVPVKRWHWFLGLRLPVIVGLLVLSALLATTGCMSGGLSTFARGQENRIRVVSHEAAIAPRVILTGHVSQGLHNVAVSASATVDSENKRRPMVLTSTDGQVPLAMVPGMGPRTLILSTADINAASDLLKIKSPWRYALKSTVTVLPLGGILLLCLGVLLGSSWTIQTFQPKLRQLAAERRRLNEEWAAVHSVRQRDECTRCTHRLSEQD
jgi:hypothetical protein